MRSHAQSPFGRAGFRWRDTGRTRSWTSGFCGFVTESADPITLCASWVDEDGDEREQYGKAHRAC